MRIGSKLSWLCQLVTFLVMGLFLLDFLTLGAHPVENNAVVVYLALLAAYAADKEVGRWAARKDPRQAPVEKKGSLFVVLWVFFYFAAYLAHLAGPEWKVPEGLAHVVVSVLGVFFGTGVSKRLFGMLRPEGTPLLNMEVVPSRPSMGPIPVGVQAQRDQKVKEGIQALLKESKEGLSVSQIAGSLGFSKRTTLRHLNCLSPMKLNTSYPRHKLFCQRSKKAKS